MSIRKPRYWILHMEERDRQPNAVRPTMLPPFAIQALAPGGGPTEAITFIGEQDTEATLEGRPVPPALIEAAKRLSEGEGLYLDANGEPVEPF